MNTTQELINDIRYGRLIILLDDEHRENEGDLIMAAEKVRPEHINFMITHGRGLFCLPMSANFCQRLNLTPMVQKNSSTFHTNFTTSIGATRNITTGISVADRFETVRAAIANDARPGDIVSPGHVFPIMAAKGGVLTRQGHTEASTDLARLAGLKPAAVLTEILNPDGSMARKPELLAFAKRHQLKIGTVADLVAYRQKHPL